MSFTNSLKTKLILINVKGYRYKVCLDTNHEKKKKTEVVPLQLIIKCVKDDC
ncbi:hypothetical protein Fmac_018619 [Flemingia macrophylla]|uniref:Ribosomal protein L33 n=1 Tax=Flemingia macrophylla TaxID=520843 RepID=A0ABD1M661_9FABA